jgi:hypothetical protein
LQLLGVAEIGANDQQGIGVGRSYDVGEPLNPAGTGSKGQTFGSHCIVRLKDAAYARTIEQGNIAQMFLTHHAAADDAITDGFKGRRGQDGLFLGLNINDSDKVYRTLRQSLRLAQETK